MKTLWHRIQRITASQAHRQLDQMEQPEAMLNQVQREMVTAVTQAKTALGRAEAMRLQLQKKMEAETRTVADMSGLAEKALKAGNVEMARNAIGCKQDAQGRIESLQEQLSQAEQLCSRQKQQLEKLKRELADMRGKRMLLLQRAHFAKAMQQAGAGLAQTAEPIGEVILRMEEKVLYDESAAQAMLGVEDAQTDPLLGFAREQAIEAELLALMQHSDDASGKD